MQINLRDSWGNIYTDRCRQIWGILPKKRLFPCGDDILWLIYLILTLASAKYPHINQVINRLTCHLGFASDDDLSTTNLVSIVR